MPVNVGYSPNIAFVVAFSVILGVGALFALSSLGRSTMKRKLFPESLFFGVVLILFGGVFLLGSLDSASNPQAQAAIEKALDIEIQGTPQLINNGNRTEINALVDGRILDCVTYDKDGNDFTVFCKTDAATEYTPITPER